MIYTVTLYNTECGTDMTQWYLSSNFEAKVAENALYSTVSCLSVGLQFVVLWNEVSEMNLIIWNYFLHADVRVEMYFSFWHGIISKCVS